MYPVLGGSHGKGNKGDQELMYIAFNSNVFQCAFQTIISMKSPFNLNDETFMLTIFFHSIILITHLF